MANGFILGASTSEKIQIALRRNERFLGGKEQDILEWLATRDNLVMVARISGVLIARDGVGDFLFDTDPFLHGEAW